jgi:hypothetical protein
MAWKFVKTNSQKPQNYAITKRNLRLAESSANFIQDIKLPPPAEMLSLSSILSL